MSEVKTRPNGKYLWAGLRRVDPAVFSQPGFITKATAIAFINSLYWMSFTANCRRNGAIGWLISPREAIRIHHPTLAAEAFTNQPPRISIWLAINISSLRSTLAQELRRRLRPPEEKKNRAVSSHQLAMVGLLRVRGAIFQTFESAPQQVWGGIGNKR